jgi:alkylhydroperoxidase family enzyme
VTWLPQQADGASEFERVFGLRANLFAAWREFASLLWTARLAPPVLLQLVQLRVRQLHGVDVAGAQRMSEALAAGWDEARVAQLATWWQSERFDATERACLRLAEQFVLDAKGITDVEVAPVREALGDATVVALVEALAIFDGFTRFQKMLGIAEASGASPRAARRSRAESNAAAKPGMRIGLPRPLGNDPIQASALAHQPAALAAFMKLYGTLWSRGLLDHSTREMARIRSARTVDCGF